MIPRSTDRAASVVAAAADTGRPPFLRQRDAHDDFLAVMKNFDDRLGAAVVRCFSGSHMELFDYLSTRTGTSASSNGSERSAEVDTCANGSPAFPRTG